MPSSEPSCVDDFTWVIDGSDGNPATTCESINSLVEGTNISPSVACGAFEGIISGDKSVFEACCVCGGSINISRFPSLLPSDIPSLDPSDIPSSFPSLNPSADPSFIPSDSPSDVPSISLSPSFFPSFEPSVLPSDQPSQLPSSIPSSVSSDIPSDQPSLLPSSIPSSVPSDILSDQPSQLPSSIPSNVPLDIPSDQPSSLPSSIPCPTDQWKKQDGSCAVNFCDACPTYLTCEANANPALRGKCFDCSCGFCRANNDPANNVVFRESCCKQSCTTNPSGNCKFNDFNYVGTTGSNNNVCSAAGYITNLATALKVDTTSDTGIDQLCSCTDEMDNANACTSISEITSGIGDRSRCYADRSDGLN